MLVRFKNIILIKEYKNHFNQRIQDLISFGLFAIWKYTPNLIFSFPISSEKWHIWHSLVYEKSQRNILKYILKSRNYEKKK